MYTYVVTWNDYFRKCEKLSEIFIITHWKGGFRFSPISNIYNTFKVDHLCTSAILCMTATSDILTTSFFPKEILSYLSTLLIWPLCWA